MRKLSAGLAASALVFGVVAAGASALVLDGSDSAPGSGKTDAACAGPLVVTNPVEQGGHDNNRITHVTITGDMTKCTGQTLLTEVDLDGTGTNHAYGVYQFPADTTEVTLTFDATTGQFYDTAPTPSGGTLVPAGSQLEPIKAKDFGLVTLTIAKTWA